MIKAKLMFCVLNPLKKIYIVCLFTTSFNKNYKTFKSGLIQTFLTNCDYFSFLSIWIIFHSLEKNRTAWKCTIFTGRWNFICLSPICFAPHGEKRGKFQNPVSIVHMQDLYWQSLNYFLPSLKFSLQFVFPGNSIYVYDAIPQLSTNFNF